MTPEEIKRILETEIPGSKVQVEGDGRHFNLVVVGEAFEGLRKVKRQQLVLGALREQFDNGEIHAVDNMLTFTPTEWAERA
ncbi:MAG: cell division protein BolA [Porticoccaceae bacterium]|nr:cell division protein BolA [Porticoccaceae bacterium]